MKKYIFTSFLFLILALSATAQKFPKICKNGIYMQTEYKIEDKPVYIFPFEVYTIVHSNKVDGKKNTYILQLELMNRNNDHATLFTIKSTTRDILEASKNAFANKWVCDMQHKTIKFGETAIEYYNRKFDQTINFKIFRKIFIDKPKIKSRFHGVWKLKNDKVKTYKIYGDTYYLLMYFQTNKAFGEIQTLQIIDNNNTLENGNECKFSWGSGDSHQVSYYYNNSINYEIWERSSMEELESDILSTLAVDPVKLY